MSYSGSSYSTTEVHIDFFSLDHSFLLKALVRLPKELTFIYVPNRDREKGGVLILNHSNEYLFACLSIHLLREGECFSETEREKNRSHLNTNPFV